MYGTSRLEFKITPFFCPFDCIYITVQYHGSIVFMFVFDCLGRLAFCKPLNEKCVVNPFKTKMSKTYMKQIKQNEKLITQ